MSYTATQFLEKIKPLVIADMKTSGILASLTAAQAFIESNKGNSGLTQKANNLFGIKGTYNGQSVKMSTKEYINSQYVTVAADFRKYPSWAESIADHSSLFNRLSRYANLRGCTDYRLACKYVREDGYATSPTYTSTLIKCIEQYRLYEWDTEGFVNPYPVPGKVLIKGAKGNEVKWLQYVLNEKGYYLKIDGIYGPKTEAAVRDFQTKVFVDGIVGESTLSKLQLK